jgi:hypothetical protein
MEIVRSVVVDCHIEDVFDYIADRYNDPAWSPTVQAVDQLHGIGPGPGASYAVLHKPLPLRPARLMECTCVEWDPPARLGWLEKDGSDVIRVTYELEPVWTAARVTQRHEARLGARRALHPLRRLRVDQAVGRRLRSLKEVLERT